MDEELRLKQERDKSKNKHPPKTLRDEMVLQKLYEHVKSKMRSSSINVDDLLLENNLQTNENSFDVIS